MGKARPAEVPASIAAAVPAERPPEFSHQLYSSAAEIYEAMTVVLRETFNYGPFFQVKSGPRW